LDEKLAAEVERTGSLIHEERDTVLRLAIQAGLPVLVSRAEASPPEGYFAEDYPLPAEWLELEAAMAKAPQQLDR
jgi:hypothetical protein